MNNGHRFLILVMLLLPSLTYTMESDKENIEEELTYPLAEIIMEDYLNPINGKWRNSHDYHVQWNKNYNNNPHQLTVVLKKDTTQPINPKSETYISPWGTGTEIKPKQKNEKVYILAKVTGDDETPLLLKNVYCHHIEHTVNQFLGAMFWYCYMNHIPQKYSYLFKDQQYQKVNELTLGLQSDSCLEFFAPKVQELFDRKYVVWGACGQFKINRANFYKLGSFLNVVVERDGKQLKPADFIQLINKK